MTRSVEDAARVLQAIAGYDSQDANSADLPVPSYLSCLQPSNKPIIVGLDESYISAGVPAAVTQVLVDALARAGTKVEVRAVTMHRVITSWRWIGVKAVPWSVCVPTPTCTLNKHTYMALD